MVTLLQRIFLKNIDEEKPDAKRRSYGILCGVVGIILNAFLFMGKFLAGTISGSIAITADAFNNLSDAGSSVVSLVGFKLAGQKADPEHPFGHGRLEYVSGLVIAMAILMMAVELIKSSFDKILHPGEISGSPLVFAILIASIAVKMYMVYYNRSIGKRIDSASMKATATDSLSDCVATTAVLISTLVSNITGLKIDGWCGLLVGFFVLWAGIQAARDTISPLLGQPPSEEFVAQIGEIVNSHKDIEGMHDLIVHDYGPGRVMVSLHAEVPASGDILALHDTIDHIENEIGTKLNCQAVIHMDPIVTDDAYTSEIKAAVRSIVKEYDDKLTMHDFRMVPGPTHTNVIFDVVLPMGYKVPTAEVRKELQRRINAWNNTMFAVIHMDVSYIQSAD